MAASASDAHPFPIYNARYRIVLPILDADGDLVTGAASLDTELSQDQGTYADATNEATEIATNSGTYYVDLVAGEMDTKCTAGIVKTSTSGAKTTLFTLYPVRLPVIRTGTAQAGGASSITLDSNASAIDDYYVGCYVNITNNSPSNAQGQARRITAYVGSTKVATVEGTYGTNPSSASTFEVLATAEWGFRLADIRAVSAAAVSSSTAQLGVNVVSLSNNAITAASINADAITDAKVASDVTIASVTGSVGSIGNGGITSNSFASGAINAAAIAADAITDAKVASDVTIASVTGAVGSVAGAVGSVTGNVGGNVTGSVGSLAAQAKADVNAEVVDALNVDTYAEPTGAPPATTTLVRKIGQIYKHLRNAVEQTSSTQTLKNDGGSTDITASVSDNGTTFTRAKWS